MSRGVSLGGVLPLALAVVVIVGVVFGFKPRKFARLVRQVTSSSASASFDSASNGASRIRVRAIERETGRSLPGVELRCFELAPGAAVDLGALGRELCPSEVTDEEGCAVLAGSESAALIVASQGPLWGCAAVEAGQQPPITIRLEQDAPLVARVVDRDGRALEGVPLFLRGDTSVLAASSVERIRAVSSTGDGIVRIPHAQWWFFQHPSGRFFLGTEALLSQPLCVPLERESAFVRPVVCTLPELGSVEVSAADGPGRVLLACAGSLAGIEAELRDGRATFPCVETGLVLEARIEDANGARTVRGVGPRTVGERAELRVGDTRPSVLVGRALDAEGRPLSSVELEAQLATSSARSSNASAETVRTDEQGLFRVECSMPWSPGQRRELALTAAAGDDEVRREVRVDLSRVLSPGEVRLGDLRLAQSELIASGRVVDETGAPVPSAWVVVLAAKGTADDAVRPRARELDVHADESGRFEVRGQAPGSAVTLRANRRNHLASEPLSVQKGARDALIVLTRTATISGRALLNSDVEPAEIQVRCTSMRPVSDRTAKSVVARLSPGAGGAGFTVEGVAPGRVRVEFAAGSGEPFASFECDARGGEVLLDPRMDPLDLRSRLKAIELRVSDAQGRPIETGWIQRRTSGGNFAWSRQDFRNGLARLHTVDSALDLVVGAQGSRAELLLNVAGEREVVLGPDWAVRLVLRDTHALELDRRNLGCRLVPELDGHPMPLDVEAVEFDSDGEALVHLAAPGRWRIAWNLEAGPGDPGAGRESSSDYVDVDGAAVSEQVFEIDAPGAEHLARTQPEKAR